MAGMNLGKKMDAERWSSFPLAYAGGERECCWATGPWGHMGDLAERPSPAAQWLTLDWAIRKPFLIVHWRGAGVDHEFHPGPELTDPTCAFQPY